MNCAGSRKADSNRVGTIAFQFAPKSDGSGSASREAYPDGNVRVEHRIGADPPPHHIIEGGFTDAIIVNISKF